MRRRGYLCDPKPVNETPRCRANPRISAAESIGCRALKNRSFSMSPSMSHVRPNMARRCALVPFLLMLGCKDAAKEEPAPQAKAEDPAAVHPEIWPSPKWPFAKDAALEEKVAALLKKMTVEEKVGQVIQGDICCIKPEDMKQVPPGLDPRRRRLLARQQRTSARRRSGSSSPTSSTPPPSTPATAAWASR